MENTRHYKCLPTSNKVIWRLPNEAPHCMRGTHSRFFVLWLGTRRNQILHRKCRTVWVKIIMVFMTIIFLISLRILSSPFPRWRCPLHICLWNNMFGILKSIYKDDSFCFKHFPQYYIQQTHIQEYNKQRRIPFPILQPRSSTSQKGLLLPSLYVYLEFFYAYNKLKVPWKEASNKLSVNVRIIMGDKRKNSRAIFFFLQPTLCS